MAPSNYLKPLIKAQSVRWPGDTHKGNTLVPQSREGDLEAGAGGKGHCTPHDQSESPHVPTKWQGAPFLPPALPKVRGPHCSTGQRHRPRPSTKQLSPSVTSKASLKANSSSGPFLFLKPGKAACPPLPDSPSIPEHNQETRPQTQDRDTPSCHGAKPAPTHRPRPSTPPNLALTHFKFLGCGEPGQVWGAQLLPSAASANSHGGRGFSSQHPGPSSVLLSDLMARAHAGKSLQRSPAASKPKELVAGAHRPWRWVGGGRAPGPWTWAHGGEKCFRIH